MVDVFSLAEFGWKARMMIGVANSESYLSSLPYWIIEATHKHYKCAEYFSVNVLRFSCKKTKKTWKKY